MARDFRHALRSTLTVVTTGLLFTCATPTARPPAEAASRPASAVPAGFEAEARRAIAAREYEATETSEGLQAPNRAHGLRTYFDAGGARVVERGDEGAELVRLRTVALGREGDRRPVAGGEVAAAGARVEVRRAGLVEWYENAERGLEHGWTLEARPEGDGVLEIEVELGGARAAVEGESARLVTAGGRVLEYGGLAAWDARGEAVAVRLEAAAEGRVRVVVDDAGAAYPLTVDPTLRSAAFAGPEGDEAPAATGAVASSRKGGIGDGNPANADAVMQSNEPQAYLGWSVAGAGDVNGDGYDDVVVGAYLYDGGQASEGAAFVFHGGPSGIGGGGPADADAVVESNQPTGQLGNSVAGAGDVNDDGYDDVVVGAYSYTSGQPNEGAAFVFHGGPSGIGDGIAVIAADAVIQSDQASATLGSSVAGAGDVNDDGYDDVVVGADAYTSGQSTEGAAFVFHGGPSGVQNGIPSNADAVIQSDQAGATLGSSVAGAGDVNRDGYDDVVVGADGYTSGQSAEGAAFVFEGGPSGIGSGTAAIAADAVLQSNQANARLGSSVDGAGDVNGDRYDDVVVGVYLYDVDQADEGAAFVFHGGPNGVQNGDPNTADAVLVSDQPGSRMGYSVAGAGDVNSDRYGDVVVGAYVYSSGALEDGAAFVFHGSPTGIGDRDPAGADAVVESDQDGSYLGRSVAGAGDTNGDGFDDLVVGAPDYDSGEEEEGIALVFLGRPIGTDTVGVYVAASGAWFLRNENSPGPANVVFTYGAGGGGFVALSGDWDGDGDDTPGLYTPSTGAFFLRNDSSPGGADVVFTFGAANAGFVPTVGDWDGDGADTIGLYAPSTSVFFLRNQNAPGAADVVVGFGPAGSGWTPISGDWDRAGGDTVGLYDPVNSIFFLRNANAPGPADVVFGFGPAGAGWAPMAGDFDGNGTSTVGLYSPSNGFYFLRDQNAPGAADLTFGFGPAGVTPLAGDWDGIDAPP